MNIEEYREQVRKYVCPYCNAQPGQKCRKLADSTWYENWELELIDIHDERCMVHCKAKLTEALNAGMHI